MGKVAEMNQNRALLRGRRSFKETYDIYGKNPALAQSEEDKKRFTKKDIELAKKKFQKEIKKERLMNFLIVVSVIAITALVIIGLWMN